jgi:hypothetical protein
MTTFNQETLITTKSLKTTMTKRAKELVKLLERLTKQDHLYSGEQLKEMKAQLRVVKQELAELESKTSKGFGKK